MRRPLAFSGIILARAFPGNIIPKAFSASEPVVGWDARNGRTGTCCRPANSADPNAFVSPQMRSAFRHEAGAEGKALARAVKKSADGA